MIRAVIKLGNIACIVENIVGKNAFCTVPKSVHRIQRIDDLPIGIFTVNGGKLLRKHIACGRNDKGEGVQIVFCYKAGNFFGVCFHRFIISLNGCAEQAVILAQSDFFNDAAPGVKVHVRINRNKRIPCGKMILHPCVNFAREFAAQNVAEACVRSGGKHAPFVRTQLAFMLRQKHNKKEKY